MRFLVLILSCLLAIPTLAAGPLAAGAGVADKSAPVSIAERKKQDLDKLLASLSEASTAEEGVGLERQILALWTESGSATVDLFMSWASTAMNAQNFPRTLDLLDQAIVLKPDFAEAYNRRATVYFMMGDYRHSIADIETTLALEPRHFGALSGLGMILLDIGDNKRAEEIYRQLLKINPQMATAREALDKLEQANKGSAL